MIYIAYSIVVFAWLAVPLLNKIARQLLPVLDTFRREYLVPAAWRI